MEPTILGSRRSYEFPADEIRLTLLSNAGVVDHIRTLFNCAFGQIGSPAPTFGVVQPTMPPGLVFDYGLIPYPEETGTALRFLHIESHRIVIDTGGPSESIQPAYDLLTQSLRALKAADGAPAIGQPDTIYDFSEIRWRSPGHSLLNLIAPELRPILEAHFAGFRANPERSFIPSVRFRMPLAGSDYSGDGTPEHETFTIDLRAGTPVDDLEIYSAAPLPSDKHFALIKELSPHL